MTVFNIRNHSVDIDVADELREHDFGYGARWTEGKLIASSPFRDDRAPSFYVNLTGDHAGTWGDSGSVDERHARGGFVALIAHMNGTSYEEAGDYLIDKYGSLYAINADEPIRIKAPKIKQKAPKRGPLEVGITQATSPYLTSRGISAEVQKRFSAGYAEDIKGYTALPWYAETGRLANVKYRSTRDKKFFYAKNATPVNSLVYGIDFYAGRGDPGAVVICEGEIDALSWETAGINAIAIGGAHISREQVELIKRSQIRKLILGGDNDKQGDKLNEQVARELGGFVNIAKIDYGAYNDANDVLLAEGVEGLEEIASRETNGNRLHLCNIIVT